MHEYNKLIQDVIGGKNMIDTNTKVGNFGHVDSKDVEPKEAKGDEKLILYLDSGIEIHIPKCIFNDMVNAMNGNNEQECDMEGELECPHENEESSEENDKGE